MDNKKSETKTNFVLIIVIIILVLIIGGIFLMTSRNNKPDNSSKSLSDADEVTTEITEEETVTSAKAAATTYNTNDTASETTTVNHNAEVYQCNAIGRINAPDNELVNGYATSYIVDGGEVSYTRTDLMDGWYITAVRYCVFDGIIWYELYDADDGDYYGWVDEGYINFYPLQDEYALNNIKNSQQIITVDSNGTSCTVKLYEYNQDKWQTIRQTYGIVGKNGVSEKSQEGDYLTPKGLFSLGFAFGIEQISDLHIEYRQINNNCYWIDDSESPLYNQWIESSDITWNSAEHLSDYPIAYKYAVVINYNMNPVIQNKGSAIFLHCMTGSYTAGCIAVPEYDMLYILNWLDSAKNPVIIIE